MQIQFEIVEKLERIKKKKNNFTEHTRKYFICGAQHVYMHMYYAHIESAAWEGMGKLYRS